MTMLPKILIVDDEPVIRDLLESLLAPENFDLLFAENGEEGYKMARECQPDAILLDVMMPGMDGYETCRQIRANPALAEIPVIILTALDDRESRLAGLLAGADDFLTKPFDMFEMKVRVRNIMRLNRYRNIVAERSRFFWVVDNDEKGYLILNEKGDIQYANQRAQIYFHLPEAHTGIDFEGHAALYYEAHSPEGGHDGHASGDVFYLVQPESSTARAFWLWVEVLYSPLGLENQRLIRVSDVTDKMSSYQDVRKVHLTVAHKLRTPVSQIFSSMNLLEDKMELMTEAEIRSLVGDSWKGAKRLVNEVREILKYIDAPIALSEGNPASPNEIGRLVSQAGSLLNLENIAFSLPDSLAGLKLKISRNAMELVVFELLENSKKFHPAQAPRVEICVESLDENHIQIQFMDDGQSMTAEQLNRAKWPYLQGEKWFTGEVPGMGLGLSLVSTLVWQSGGKVRLANREDQTGICVTLTLPILTAERQET